MAIQLAAKKLRKKPDDQKTIEILVNSWEISNRVDKDDLNSQLASSNPNWEQVYAIYKRLDDRQRIVKQLPKLKPDNHRLNVNFEFEDYVSALNNAKQHAIQDLTNKGDEYLAKGDRFNARTAYEYYNKAYGYDNSNGNIKSKSDQAFAMGLTHVLIQATPANMVNLPENFIRQALDKRWNNLESTWLRLHNTFQSGTIYHYYTDVLINSVIISPERVAETSYVDTKKIEDGWEYVKNTDGSVKTDSLGNKLKQPVYRDITCTVRKYTMTKEATVNGTVIIYGIDSDRRYANDIIQSVYTYKYEYATVQGDSRALSKTSQDLANKPVGTFPLNNDLIMNSSANFGSNIYDKVNQYKSSFQ